MKILTDINGKPYINESRKALKNSEPTLITKTITKNGNYSAINDNADGYSEVNVQTENRINSLLLRTLQELTEEDMRGLTAIDELRVPIYGNTGLESIFIPDTIKSTTPQSFRNATKLKTVNISNLDKYASISFGSIYGCPTTAGAKLYLNGEPVTDLPLSNSITEIKSNTFYNCQSLTSVELMPDTITSIGGTAFSNCYHIISVIIPNSVTTMGAEAFRFCSNVKTVVIGSGITNMGTRCLANLTKLKYLKIKALNPPTFGTDVLLSSTGHIIIPFDSVTQYKTATNFVQYATGVKVGFGTFGSGVVLPTQTTDTNYTLTWYATIEDLRAETNPITVGNGEEVYCTFA